MKIEPNKYSVIAEAIRIIDSTESRDLSLYQLAEDVGINSTTLSELFNDWSGVSPIKFRRYLAASFAKELLQRRHTKLNEPMSLIANKTIKHSELLVHWNVMSQDEFRKGGADLQINWGWFDSPFGNLLVMGTSQGLCGIAFASDDEREASAKDLFNRWPRAAYNKDKNAVQDWVNAILLSKGNVQIHLMGSSFHIKIWEMLLAIPFGWVTTYSDIARQIGAPKAQRAVGTAVGRNPVSWLIPCHRALQKTGQLGGYHWGLTVKRSLLAWETSCYESNKHKLQLAA